MSAEKIKAFERRGYEEMNKGKAATMTEMDEDFATNIVFHSGFGSDIRGLKDYKQFMSEFYDALPDLHWTLDDIIVEGDKAVVRWTATGTHKGALMGIPATNKKVTVWGIGIDKIVGGKVVEAWGRMDTLGFMQQLGVVPTPGKGK
jgi:steroid delta-isomerase-like uncharacterized protein